MLEIIEGNKCYEVLDDDNYILFYFGASWCGPCQQVLPKINELSQKYDNEKIKFYKIDIDNDKNNKICDSCQIKVIPAFLLFNGRNFIDRRKGNNIPGVTEMINSRLFPPVNFEVLDKNNPIVKEYHPQQQPPPQQPPSYQKQPPSYQKQPPSSYQQNPPPQQLSEKDPYQENRKIFDKSKLFL